MTTPTLLRVGLDIGGTKTEAVALDPNGRLVGRLRMPTELGAERVLATAERAVRGLSFQTGRPLSAFASIGIGIPGAVDRETGEVRHAFNLDLAELQLGSLLSELVGVPVRVENDVTAAALGANHLLELDGTIAYLNLGTGLAAGIVVDGAPWRGAHGVAGEIGHLPIDPNGYACPCGQFGCLETVASGSAISRAWPHGGEHPAQDVVRAMEAGDVEAAAVVARLVQGAASCVRSRSTRSRSSSAGACAYSVNHSSAAFGRPSSSGPSSRASSRRSTCPAECACSRSTRRLPRSAPQLSGHSPKLEPARVLAHPGDPHVAHVPVGVEAHEVGGESRPEGAEPELAAGPVEPQQARRGHGRRGDRGARGAVCIRHRAPNCLVEGEC